MKKEVKKITQNVLRLHELDFITDRNIIETGHYATYRDTLKIMVPISKD